MFKKIVLFTVISILCISITACGNNNQSTETSSTTTHTTVATQPLTEEQAYYQNYFNSQDFGFVGQSVTVSTSEKISSLLTTPSGQKVYKCYSSYGTCLLYQDANNEEYLCVISDEKTQWYKKDTKSETLFEKFKNVFKDEETFKEDTLALLALINNNYWSKNQSKEDLIMNYAVIDKNAQAQLNSQLEKNNIFTKIDVPQDSSGENLPVAQTGFLGTVKKVLSIFKC